LGQLHIGSTSGRLRRWDAVVYGCPRGEGFAAVIMKPPSQATADTDHIDCIVRETGISQDGHADGVT
ncbi:hypothetical protein EV356DRAFT_423124, partial [Viridothelium virens]